MKNKVISVLTIVVILAALFTGCSKTDSPAASFEPAVNSQENNAMVKYNELIKANSSPKQILDFVRTNIGNLDKNDAETVIDGFIYALSKKLESCDLVLL